MKVRMKKLPTYEEFIAESSHHTKIGNRIEFIVPGTHNTHTGKVLQVKPDHLLVLDDKTGKNIKVPVNAIGPAYESEEE